MTATLSPARSFDIVFDSQAVFRTILDAMARPGKVGLLTALDPRCPLPAYRPLAAVVRTLLDHEVTFAVAPDEVPAVAPDLARYLAAATGSRPAAPAEADYVLARGPLPRGLLAGLKRGSLAFPDEGATLLILTPDFETAASALPVTLAGPGIPGTLATRLAGLSAEDLAERRIANAEVPRGVDLLLVDPTGRVVCLPRTTKVEAG
jgi:alpha-D-ribose 1-methylphosphonate 5-triphosphate synthase subunit PhnH